MCVSEPPISLQVGNALGFQCQYEWRPRLRRIANMIRSKKLLKPASLEQRFEVVDQFADIQAVCTNNKNKGNLLAKTLTGLGTLPIRLILSAKAIARGREGNDVHKVSTDTHAPISSRSQQSSSMLKYKQHDAALKTTLRSSYEGLCIVRNNFLLMLPCTQRKRSLCNLRADDSTTFRNSPTLVCTNHNFDAAFACFSFTRT